MKKIEKYYIENKHILPLLPSASMNDNHLFEECDTFVKKLEEKGKKHLFSLLSVKNFDRNSVKLEFVKCPSCQNLTKGWEKFYDSLDRFSLFLKNGNIPSKPSYEAEKKCCKETEQECEKYMNTIIDEIECLKREKTKINCPQTKLPEFSLGDSTCYSCKQIYEKWALITFTLLDIAHYIRMTA